MNKWYYKLALGATICFIPLFAIVSALTQDIAVMAVRCQLPNGTQIVEIANLELKRDGTLRILNDKVDMTIDLEASVCMLGKPPKPKKYEQPI